MAKQALIDITPHKSIMRKIAQTGYKAEDAIAELVDNAIDARGDNLNVDITLSPDRIIVADNGCGMDFETASNAMKLGFSTKKGQLGEFGLGLKTSALSMGGRFLLSTAQAGSPEEYSVAFDIEDWLEHGSWSGHVMDITEKENPEKSGTKVTIELLKFPVNEKLLERIRNHLGIRFGPYISSGNVSISVNGSLCTPETPLLTSEGKK